MKQKGLFFITPLLLFGLIKLSFASMPVFKDGAKKIQTYELDIGWNATPAQLDWDRDGLRDLVIGDKEGYVWFYRNTGTEFNPIFTSGEQIKDFNTHLPIDVGEFATPFVIDYDNNGLYDLIVGNKEGILMRFPMTANPPYVNSPIQISLTNNTLREVYFISPSTGWLVGDNGVIFQTIDGGNTWMPQQSNTNENINSVYFLNQNEGWAVGNKGTILRYNGSVWQSGTSTTPRNLHSIFFVDSNNGWAVGDRGVILHYANDSWTTQNANITDDFHSVFFMDAKRGWIVGERGAAAPTIFETTNGGVAWTAMAAPLNTDFYSITRAPGTNNILWAVGANGTILRYDGQAWSLSQSGVNTDLYAVHFINENTGWAVGANGVILQYANNAWNIVPSGVTANLYSIYFKDATHGWAVGDNNTILFYNGVNWITQALNIDVGYNSAPFIFDLDEDGKKDLLIGDDPGNVWFFKNVSSDDTPAFNYGFRMSVGSQAVTGTATNFIDVGQFATPQVVDWTGDGVKDLIIGNGEGNVYLFKGIVTTGTQTQGLIPLPGNRILVFEPGKKIQASNLDIDVGQRSAPLVIDWNKDGGLDLVIGVECGSLDVFLNDTPYQPPQFSVSSKVQGPPSSLRIGLYSTPAIIDWDNDHRKDLLLGDEDGFVTLFLNSGTDKDPIFTAGFELKVYGTSAQIGTFTENIDVGNFARPFPIDWDNDGKKDLIVGNNLGQVIFFRNIGSDNAPLFAPGVVIQAGSPSSTNLDVGDNAAPVVVDWDNDGRKDLIIGNKEGCLFLYLNTGKDEAPVFGSSTKLTTPSSDIDVGEFAVPFVVDYNGDHKKDVVVGDSDGYISTFLNIGTDKEPILDKGIKIRIENEGDIDVGKHAAPWVVDYDNSCSFDLVVGNKDGYVNLYLSSGVVDIYITKGVDKTYASMQDILTYTIEYGNRGNFNASNVEIIEDIPPLTELIEPAEGISIDTILYFVNDVWTSQYSQNATRIKWIRNQLLQKTVGQKVSFKVRVSNIGTISNYANIKSDQTYLQRSNIVTVIATQIPTPDFSFARKSVYPEGEVLPGTVLTFTIKYKNTGNGTATNVIITDVIDFNLCNVTNISHGGKYTQGTISWDLGDILVGYGGEVGFEATVLSPLPQGVVIRNTALITANQGLWQTNEVEVVIPELGCESDDWPMFHFNLSHEGYDFREVIRPPLQITWTSTLSSNLLSSPVIANGILYLASSDKVNIFNAQSGELVYTYSTTAYIDSTPAVAKGMLYTADSKGNVFCWNSNPNNPELKWTYPLGENVHLSSPAVAEGRVYIGGGKNLYALNAAKREFLWSYPSGGEIQSSPVVANGKVYFGSADGNLYCLSTSGELKWRFGTVGTIYSSPAVKDGIVYVGSNDTYIYAIEANTGKEVWKYKTNDKVNSSPAVAEEVIFCGSQDGYFYAINKNGILKWGHLIGSPIESSPAVANGVVYFGANDGYIYGLDVNTGNELWRYYTGTNRIYSSPAIVDGILYIASSAGKIYAFTSHADFSNSELNKKLGSPVGTLKAGDEITYSIKFYNEGLGEATNFKIEDTLNPYLQFISASNNGTYSNGVVTWEMGNIGHNSGGSVILRVKVGTNTPNNTLIANSAKFSWDISLFKNTNEVTNRIIKEMITLLKVVNPSKTTFTPGESLVYTISYKNNGSTTLTGVNIVDKVSPYLRNIIPANNGKYEGETITWQINNIGPNGSGEVKFNSQVISPLANGAVIPNNTALFNSQQISTPILAQPGTLTIISPDFSSSFKTSTGTFIPGNTITYVINYTNTGSVTATGVEIWDVVDDNLIVETISNGGNYNPDNQTIKWSLGQVNRGSVSFKAKIKMPIPHGTLIRNKATIKADTMPDFVTNEVIGTVTSTPDFRYSSKEVYPKDGIPLNKILTYTINYINTGQMDAEDVVITDRLDPHLSVSTLTSYAEVITGPGTINLKVDNGWTQFDYGTVDGNITIVTSDGTYTASINAFPQIQGLIDSINNNLTANVNISYDSNTDRFTIHSRNGSLIKLEESGINPFFRSIKIPTGIYCSGNYSNGAISWDIGKVKVGEGGSVTFRAMVIGTPTIVTNRGTITFFGIFNTTNEVTNVIDITPPPPGPPPTEGGLTDLDADVDGNYTIYWQGWNDNESGIAMYELQESIDKVNWTTLSNTIPGNTKYWEVTNRIKGNIYYYRLRAMNGAGIWSDYSTTSDGIRIVDQLKIVNPATSSIVILESPTQLTSASGQTVVEIPPGAFNGTVTFVIYKTTPPTTDLMKSSPIISAILDNSCRELMALEEDYYGKGTQPLKPIIITLPYSDPDVNEEDDDLSYRIYRLAGDHWEYVPGRQQVDVDKNLVTAYEVKQLSIFAIGFPITHLQKVIVFPNPFKLRLGHKEVKFWNLSGKVSLWIYNIAGELVFNKDDIIDNPYLWPIVNNKGERVASGVYIYIITNERGEKLTGKIAIIK